MHTFARQPVADHQNAGGRQSRAPQDQSRDRQGAAAHRRDPLARPAARDGGRFLAGAALRPRRSSPNGFTLVELLVVITIILLLTVMTIGVINISSSERVRSGARQVQSVIEGARDRAIYAQHPRGIRLLINEDILDPSFTPPTPTIVSSLVYIGTGQQETSQEDRDDRDGDTDVSELYRYVQFPDQSYLGGMGFGPNEPIRRAIIGVNTNWTALYQRGLLGPDSRISVTDTATGTTCEYKIDPRSFPIKRDQDDFIPGGYGGLNGMVPPPPQGYQLNGPNDFSQPTPNRATYDELLYLLWDTNCLTVSGSTPTQPWRTPRLAYSIPLSGDVLSGEKVSLLPRNVCIDLQTSHLPSGWVVYNAGTNNLQYSNTMDLMFSPGGGVIGDAGGAGIIHLHVCDVGDAMSGTLPGSPTKPDGTPREGDEFGITIFTRSGRVIVHPMDLTGTGYPAPWVSGKAYARGNLVAPPLYNGLVYQCVTAGTTGSGQPNWNGAPGGQTTDGGAVWVGVKHDVWNFGEEGEVAK